MSTEKQRQDQIKKNTNASKRKVKKIIDKRRDAVTGAISSAVSAPNFVSSAKFREALFIELSKQYKAFNSDINDWVTSEVKVTAKNFFDYAKEDLPKGAVSMTFGQFSDKYVSDIIAQINPATIDKQVAINAQIGGMLQRDIQILRAAVSTTIMEAVVEGLTNPEMAARMAAKVKNAGAGLQFIDKSGRRWTADAYLGMLNRTLHANAARQSYADLATKEAGFDLYQIDGGVTGSSLDNPSDPCDKWAGRIFSMTGATKGFPTYQDVLADGVFHPQCVHSYSVVLPSEMDAALKERKDERQEYREMKAEADKNG